jgi:predicted HTH domain antitoxin
VRLEDVSGSLAINEDPLGSPIVSVTHTASVLRRTQENVMTISFELPPDIEEQIRMNGASLGREARELLLVELYRQDRITHHQLSEALGLTRLETDGLLKRHKVSSGPTLEELQAEIGSLRDSRPE